MKAVVYFTRDVPQDWKPTRTVMPVSGAPGWSVVVEVLPENAVAVEVEG